LKALITALVCLLLIGAAFGQTTAPPPLKTRPNPPAAETASTESAVPADAPVITIQGLCERPGGGTATPSDCKTVVTRAEFEKIVNAVQPNMPQAAKKQFASRYVTVLMLAEKAHELGLDHGPAFDEELYLSRLQILSKLAAEQLQKEATKVSDTEVADYYKEHAADYKAISFDKLYVPKQKTVESSALKPNDPELQKKREASEAEMKEEADKLRARAAAGEDVTKLQQEAYDFAGLKQKAQSTRMENQRKSGIPPADASIFELKAGDVSQVFTDAAGFMIYKIVEVKDLPVASVHDEIARTLQAQKMKNSFEALQNSAKPDYAEAYFATPAPPTLRNPGETPAQNTPPPGKK